MPEPAFAETAETTPATPDYKARFQDLRERVARLKLDRKEKKKALALLNEEEAKKQQETAQKPASADDNAAPKPTAALTPAITDEDAETKKLAQTPGTKEFYAQHIQKPVMQSFYDALPDTARDQLGTFEQFQQRFDGYGVRKQNRLRKNFAAVHREQNAPHLTQNEFDQKSGLSDYMDHNEGLGAFFRSTGSDILHSAHQLTGGAFTAAGTVLGSEKLKDIGEIVRNAGPEKRIDRTTVDDFWDAPMQNAVPFIFEQAFDSALYMAGSTALLTGKALGYAAGVGLGVGWAGDIAQQRATNDGREDPTGADLAIAVPAVMFSLVSPHIPIKIAFPHWFRPNNARVMQNIANTSATKKIAKAGVLGGGAEGLQEAIEHTAATYGTAHEEKQTRKQYAQELLSVAAIGAIVGGPISTAVGGIGAIGTKDQRANAIKHLDKLLENYSVPADLRKSVITGKTPIEIDGDTGDLLIKEKINGKSQVSRFANIFGKDGPPPKKDQPDATPQKEQETKPEAEQAPDAKPETESPAEPETDADENLSTMESEIETWQAAGKDFQENLDVEQYVDADEIEIIAAGKGDVVKISDLAEGDKFGFVWDIQKTDEGTIQTINIDGYGIDLLFPPGGGFEIAFAPEGVLDTVPDAPDAQPNFTAYKKLPTGVKTAEITQKGETTGAKIAESDQAPAPEQQTTSAQPAPAVEGIDDAVESAQETGQARDIESMDSRNQVESIARNLDFNQVNASVVFDTGAPAVEAKAVNSETTGGESYITQAGKKLKTQYVVAEAENVRAERQSLSDTKLNETGEVRAINNGRAAGIKLAYRAYADKAAQYKTDLIKALPGLGFDAKAIAEIEAMKSPMLVRAVADAKGESFGKIANQSNQGVGLSKNATEQANEDAGKLSPDQWPDTGIESEAVLRSVLEQVGATEQINDANGRLNQTARTRAKNAIVARAYRDKQITALVSDDSDASRRVVNALLGAAKKIAALQSADPTGTRAVIIKAVKAFIAFRKRNEKSGIGITEYLAQKDAFSNRDPKVDQVLGKFFSGDKLAGQKQIDGALNALADTALNEEKAHHSGQATLPGTGNAKSTKEIIDHALKDEISGELFASPPKKPSKSRRPTPKKQAAPKTPQALGRDDIIRSLAKTFGEKGIQRLLKTNVLNVVSTFEELPQFIQDAAAGGAKPSGVTTNRRTKVYLVADQLEPDTIKGVFLHEMGVHLGLPRMVGTKEFARIINWTKTREGPAWEQARERARSDPSDEEVLAYFIEENSQSGTAQRLIARIRQFLRRLGLVRGYTDSDLINMARAAALGVIEGRPQTRRTLFSIPSPKFSRPAKDKPIRAIHSLQVSELWSALKTGGLLAPSVAIQPHNVPHQWGHYGVDLIFRAGAIDPKKDNITAGDGYTPVIPQLHYIVPNPIRDSFIANIMKEWKAVPDNLKKVVLDSPQRIWRQSDKDIDNRLEYAAVSYKAFEEREIQSYLISMYLHQTGRKKFSMKYGPTDILNKGDNQEKYDRWLDEALERWSGGEGYRAIFKGWTDQSQKSWSKATPENILRDMRDQKKEVSFFDGPGKGVGLSREKIKSTKSLKKLIRQKQILSRDELKETKDERQRLTDEYTDHASEIAHKIPGVDISIANDIIGRNSRSENDLMYALRREWAEFLERDPDQFPDWDLREDVAGAIDALNKLKALPLNFFEAKPMRLVPLEDVAVALVRPGFPAPLAKELRKRGIKVKRKGADVSDADLAALQSPEDALFSRPEARDDVFFSKPELTKEQRVFADLFQAIRTPDDKPYVTQKVKARAAYDEAATLYLKNLQKFVAGGGKGVAPYTEANPERRLADTQAALERYEYGAGDPDMDTLYQLNERSPKGLRAYIYQETKEINKSRFKILKENLSYLMDNDAYSAPFKAIAMRMSTKFRIAMEENNAGHVMPVADQINERNRHPLMDVSGEMAAEFLEQIENAKPGDTGKTLFAKAAYNVHKARQKAAGLDMSRKGWVKYPQSTDEGAGDELATACTGKNSWCTKTPSVAQSQREEGDFWVYYENGEPEVAIQMDEDDQVLQVRGSGKKQALSEEKYYQVANDKIKDSGWKGSEGLIREMMLKKAVREGDAVGVLKGISPSSSNKLILGPGTGNTFTVTDFIIKNKNAGVSYGDYPDSFLEKARAVVKGAQIKLDEAAGEYDYPSEINSITISNDNRGVDIVLKGLYGTLTVKSSKIGSIYHTERSETLNKKIYIQKSTVDRINVYKGIVIVSDESEVGTIIAGEVEVFGPATKVENIGAEIVTTGVYEHQRHLVKDDNGQVEIKKVSTKSLGVLDDTVIDHMVILNTPRWHASLSLSAKARIKHISHDPKNPAQDIEIRSDASSLRKASKIDRIDVPRVDFNRGIINVGTIKADDHVSLNGGGKIGTIETSKIRISARKTLQVDEIKANRVSVHSIPEYKKASMKIGTITGSKDSGIVKTSLINPKDQIGKIITGRLITPKENLKKLGQVDAAEVFTTEHLQKTVLKTLLPRHMDPDFRRAVKDIGWIYEEALNHFEKGTFVASILHLKGRFSYDVMDEIWDYVQTKLRETPQFSRPKPPSDNKTAHHFTNPAVEEAWRRRSPGYAYTPPEFKALPGKDKDLYHRFAMLKDLSDIQSEVARNPFGLADAAEVNAELKAVSQILSRNARLRTALVKYRARLAREGRANDTKIIPRLQRVQQELLKKDLGAVNRAKLEAKQHVLMGELTEENWNLRFQRKFSDKMKPIQTLIKDIERLTGKPLPGEMNAYRAEQVIYSQAEYALQEFDREYRTPLAKFLGRKKISLDDLSWYAYAKFAPERNAELQEKGAENDSGMSDAKAQAILERKPDAIYPLTASEADLKTAHKMLLNVSRFIRENAPSGNLYTPEQVAQWPDHKYYVPLQNFMDPDHVKQRATMIKLFRGGIKGPEFRKAGGRASLAGNVVANTFQQAHEIIVREHNNKIVAAYGRMALAHPRPNLYRVHKGNFVPRIVNGKVQQRIVENAEGKKQTNLPLNVPDVNAMEVAPVMDKRYADHMIGFKLNGEQYYLEFFGDLGKLHLHVLNNAGPDTGLGELSRAIIRTMRLMAFFYTISDVTFLLTNPQRDFEFGLVSAIAETDKKGRIPKAKILPLIKEIIANYGPAIIGYNDYVRQRGNSGQDLTGARARWENNAREFHKSGGKVGTFALYDFELQLKRLSDDILRESGGAAGFSLKSSKAMLDFILEYAETLENAMRLATTIASRDYLLKAEEKALLAAPPKKRAEMIKNINEIAATLGKDATVNFNKRGEYTKNLSVAYLFVGVGIGGIKRFIEIASTTRGKAVMAGFIMYAYLNSKMGFHFGEDDFDDDDRNDFEQIAHWKLSRATVLNPWNQEGEFLLWNRAYGLTVLQNIGRFLAHVEEYFFNHYEKADGTPPTEALKHLWASFMESFMPIGYEEARDQQGDLDLSGTIVRTITPFLLTPIVQHMTNKAWHGGEIRHERTYPGQAVPPDAYRGKAFTHDNWKDIAIWMNRITGGNEDESGLMDFNPDTIRHYFNFVFGGFGRSVIETFNLIDKMAKDEDIDVRRIPVLKRQIVLAEQYKLGKRHVDAIGKDLNTVHLIYDKMRNKKTSAAKRDELKQKLISPEYRLQASLLLDYMKFKKETRKLTKDIFAAQGADDRDRHRQLSDELRRRRHFFALYARRMLKSWGTFYVGPNMPETDITYPSRTGETLKQALK